MSQGHLGLNCRIQCQLNSPTFVLACSHKGQEQNLALKYNIYLLPFHLPLLLPHCLLLQPLLSTLLLFIYSQYLHILSSFPYFSCLDTFPIAYLP